MKCTATAKRTGKPCKAPAIKGKDKCRVHGGMTPVMHGLFSKYPEAVAGEHIRAAKETELKEMLKDSAALLGAVLSAWTEKGLPFDIRFYKATCALSGRLTAAIKAHEELKQHGSDPEDPSAFDEWLKAVYGKTDVTREDDAQMMKEVWADDIDDEQLMKNVWADDIEIGGEKN